MVNSFQFTREVRLGLTHQRNQRNQRTAGRFLWSLWFLCVKPSVLFA
jgi:hypothetical protein